MAFKLLMPVAFVAALVAVSALEPCPFAGGQELKMLPDFTKTPPADLGVELLTPAKDPKTGFVVGGKNATDLIRKLTELSGRTIAQLEADMRPKKLSTAGFLGENERLLDVLAADNQYVVDELGLTHQELAKHLHVLGAVGWKLIRENQAKAEFAYHGRKFKVEVVAFRGFQESPFKDGTRASRDATVHNLDNGKQVWFSMLVPEMIERYGFYEGKGTKYRVDPRRIVEVLDFVQVKKK